MLSLMTLGDLLNRICFWQQANKIIIYCHFNFPFEKHFALALEISWFGGMQLQPPTFWLTTISSLSSRRITRYWLWPQIQLVIFVVSRYVVASWMSSNEPLFSLLKSMLTLMNACWTKIAYLTLLISLFLWFRQIVFYVKQSYVSGDRVDVVHMDCINGFFIFLFFKGCVKFGCCLMCHANCFGQTKIL